MNFCLLPKVYQASALIEGDEGSRKCEVYWINMCLCYNQGKMDSAASMIEKAILANPSYAEAYNNLGMLAGPLFNHLRSLSFFTLKVHLTFVFPAD